MGNLFDKEDFGADELEPEPESDEVQVTEDGAADGVGSGTMEGFLVKQGHVIKNWKIDTHWVKYQTSIDISDFSNAASL